MRGNLDKYVWKHEETNIWKKEENINIHKLLLYEPSIGVASIKSCFFLCLWSERAVKTQYLWLTVNTYRLKWKRQSDDRKRYNMATFSSPCA